MNSSVTKTIRVAAHPAILASAAVASAILWMPFGMGYYGWPWQIAAMRVLLVCFVYGFPALAFCGFLAALILEGSSFRTFLAVIALLVGLFGIVAMSFWQKTYVQPMLQRASTTPVTSSP